MTWTRPPSRCAGAIAVVMLLTAGCASQQTASTSTVPQVSAVNSSGGAGTDGASAGSTEVQRLLFLGDQYRSSGLPAKAAEQYEKAMELDPHNDEVYPRLGYALIEVGDFERAVKVYERYVALRPKDCNSHASLGFAYLRMEMADKAISAYESALQYCPADPNAYANLAKAYVAGGDDLEAIEAFRRAVELNPGDVLSAEKLAELLWNRRLYPEAIAVYESILAMPDHGKNDQWVGWASGRIATGYKWAKAYDKAIPYYRAQLSQDPTHVNGIRGLAQSYEETKQIDQAILLYRDLIKAKSDAAGYYYHLGDLLNEVGRHTDAIRVAKEGQKYDEGCPAYGYYVIGTAYEKLGGIPNFKRAKREFRKCAECGDAQFSEPARKQMERQDQLIKIEELKRKQAEYGY